MAKNAGKLAGLAALGAAAYMINQKFGKGKGKGNDAGDQTTSSYTKDTKKVEAKDEPFTPTDKSAYASRSNMTPMQGVGDAKNDPLPKPPKVEAKVDTDVKADAPAEVKVGDPSQSRGVLRSDRDMTQAEAKTILNQTPADKAKQAANDKKAIASNKADYKAYQRNTDAAKLANLKSNAEFNKKQQAKKAAEAHAAKMKKLKDNPELQAAEPVYPEQLLTPGGGYKTAASLAKNLANRNVVSKAPEYSTPLLTAPAKQLTGPSKADIVTRDRAAREAARQKEMLRENARRSGLDPDNMNPAVANKVRQNMGGNDFSLGMKRGGEVKMASGGMTASRRGDGIASRGKTKCKMY